MSEEVVLPPLQIAARTDQGCVLYAGPPNVAHQQYPTLPATQVVYSSDGSLLIAAHPSACDIYNSQTLQKVVSVGTVNISFVDISRSGRYLSTLEKIPREDSEFKNLKVWDLQNVAQGPIVAYRSKNVSIENWPVYQFSEDEQTLVYMGPNTVNVYKAQDNFKSAAQKLPMKGMGGFALSPSDESPFVAVFVPEAKGAPAFVSVFHIPSLPSSTSDPLPAPVARRSMFRTQGMRFYWNKSGTALLVVAFQDVDATNQSYYGEQKLHFMTTNGKIEQLVPDLKDGPIHDVQWSPNGSCFVVVCGFMPAKTILFDDKCKPVYDLGSGPVNTIRWNPQSRFFAVAGFGNLPGDISFYDKKVSGKCVLMGKVRSPSVDCSWSPCGRYVMTKIVAPRLRVDNSFKIFSYCGEPFHYEQFQVLLDVKWRPAADGIFPDLKADQEQTKQAQQTQQSGQEQAGSYVPPHLRNKTGGGSSSNSVPSSSFSLAHDPDDVVGKVKKVFADRQNARPTVPGEELVSKTTSKSARKRQNKKKNTDDKQEQGGGFMGGSSQQVQQPATNIEDLSEIDIQKRIKNLQKKYRQIQQLKERLATEGRESLEPEQITKISTEQDVMQEIQSLGGSV